MTPEEDERIVVRMNEAHPDIVWAGSSTPKQERWMYEHRQRLKVPVLVGVGAAFDINAGIKKQAPRWMREHGLEWLYRLVQELRRLWRRYLTYGSQFAFYVALELLGLKKFEWSSFWDPLRLLQELASVESEHVEHTGWSPSPGRLKSGNTRVEAPP
jgi:N-acetylglucosaminyldiphosphoundecaprenol N-acetyl-beta-D-mannosaminyltransferase